MSQCWIDGRWVDAADAADGATIAVHNPATGERVGLVPRCGADETRQAIAAAERALGPWRERTADDRSRLLRRWADLVMAQQEELAL
ncbi:MAG TPA: aldehyde dehydrogenase family protein, partial [Burkholderiaceae bacterium]|nr:aldehyde dehydrogenase family protein [Burkholderiaceae bacterium]